MKAVAHSNGVSALSWRTGQETGVSAAGEVRKIVISGAETVEDSSKLKG